MLSYRPMIWGLTAALLASVSLPAGAEQASTAQQVTLNIQAQPLGQALNRFAEQTGLQIAGLSDAWAGLTAPRVAGTLSLQAALHQLLSNTSLDFEVIDGGTTIIIRPGKARAGSKEKTVAQVESKNNRATTSSERDDGSAGPAESSEARAVATSSYNESAARIPATEAFDEVIVTGSHIRGSVAAGSKVITIGQQDIERSGHVRVQDLLEALPQNFSGSGSEDSTTDTAAYNVSRATTIDLRGLGGGTTLILVNGHRQPAGDMQGAFVDISNIPSSAIERIEILTDGASAVYGSDAIGGVVNFILRKDYEGAETSLRYGSLDGDADEIQFSQLAGQSWSKGNVLLGYQYYERKPLATDAIDYLATDGDQRSFGGSDFRLPYSNPGVIMDNNFLPAYGIPQGQDGSSLAAGDLIDLGGVLPLDYPLGQGTRQYLPEEKLHTVYLTATHSLTDHLELFASGRYGKRNTDILLGGGLGVFAVPASNPFYVNPFGGSDPVIVAYNFGKDGLMAREVGDTEIHTETVGLTAQLGDWRATFSGSYGKQTSRYRGFGNYNGQAVDAAINSTDPAAALNLFGDGANSPGVIDSIRSSTRGVTTTDTWGGGLVVDGPLFYLMNRSVRLAVGSDYRAENFETFRDAEVEFPTAEGDDTVGAKGRHVSAAFAELAIPLLDAVDARTGQSRLELSLAGRYEDYSDFGTTFNPKVGVRFDVSRALQLRGTWGTSYRAPKLVEMSDGVGSNRSRVRETTVADPRSPSDTLNVLLRVGPNPDLHEETADVWSAGLDFSPQGLKGLTASLTYFHIDYSDKITFVGFESLQNPSAYPGVVDFDPSPEVIASFCDSAPGTCTGAPVDAVLELGLYNLSKQTVDGLDADIGYSFGTDALGDFQFSVGGTYMAHYDRTVVSGGEQISLVDTVGFPLALRLRGNLSWAYKQWGTSVTVNHAGRYLNPGNIPDTVDSYTSVDLNIGYRIAGPGWLNRSRISFSIVNAFDELPPFINTSTGYDTANGDATGRKWNLLFTKEW